MCVCALVCDKETASEWERGDCSYLSLRSVESKSQETHKRVKAARKQSQVQDNDKVKCAVNGLVQSRRDKALCADRVRAAEGNGRSREPPRILPHPPRSIYLCLSALGCHLLDKSTNSFGGSY